MQAFPFPGRGHWQGLLAVGLQDGATNAHALVSDHGAHVLSWVPDTVAGECLFMSARSAFASGKAIRGGVPLIFPQFGTIGEGPRHGVARVVPWQLVERNAQHVRYVLHCHEKPHGVDAEVIFEVRLHASTLQMCLTVINRGEASWSFGAALHTYLRVSDLATVRIEGLRGYAYLDQVAAGVKKREDAAGLQFQGEVDRIYPKAPCRVMLCDGPRKLSIHQQGFNDTVIWNPGQEKGEALADLEADDWRRFVCVEAAHIFDEEPNRPQLAPGEHWQGTQTLVWVG